MKPAVILATFLALCIAPLSAAPKPIPPDAVAVLCQERAQQLFADHRIENLSANLLPLRRARISELGVGNNFLAVTLFEQARRDLFAVYLGDVGAAGNVVVDADEYERGADQAKYH